LIVEKKWGMSLARMTPLTPYLGPWIAPFSGKKKDQEISYIQKTMADLIGQMPPLLYYAHKFNPDLQNWYAFYLKGFEQTTHYTYILRNIKNEKQLWDNLKNTVRTDIRRAKEHYKIKCKSDPDKLFLLQQKTFHRQNMKVPFARETMAKLMMASTARKCGATLFVENEKEEYVAGSFIVWDAYTAYLLMLGFDESKSGKGAVQLLLWKSIKEAAKHVDVFNFEGTMLEKVEPVFRRFGGEKTPYFKVWKDKNKLTKLIRIALGK
jgi:hypothetical protein